MKKIFSLLFAAIALAFIFICSCKKTQHSTNPTPANYRILSYTVTKDDIYPSDNYAFTYDSKNRISQIIFSTNDSGNGFTAVAPINKRAVFTYSNDTIFKVVTNIRTSKLIDSEMFITNSAGQIVNAYFGGESIYYQYYGKLLSWESDTFKNAGNSITSVRNYTSDNGDLLTSNFDGNLYLTLADSGLRLLPLAGQTLDTVLISPLTVNWLSLPPVTHTVNFSLTPDGITIFNDKISGYTLGYPVSVSATDVNGISTVDPAVTYPGGTWPKEYFGVFPDKADRMGDYWQLGSFTTYGVNIYANAHLLKSDSTLGHSTHINYTIDADSKITTFVTTTTDSALKVHSAVYNLQYETY